jgi:hypothetical protein
VPIVSESISPEKGAAGGWLRLAPPQSVVPSEVVKLTCSPSGGAVVVVVLVVVVVVVVVEGTVRARQSACANAVFAVWSGATPAASAQFLSACASDFPAFVRHVLLAIAP